MLWKKKMWMASLLAVGVLLVPLAGAQPVVASAGAGVWASTAGGPGADPAAASRSDGGGRPSEVRSLRHEMLGPSAYQQLAERWERYVEVHSRDVRAWVEWGDALRYSGNHQIARVKYERAFEIDSSDVAAVEAFASPKIHAGRSGEWRLAYLRLQRAFRGDPSYPNTPYSLVLGAMRAGDEDLVRACLQAIVDHDMPRPVLDYGRNMVAGAPEGAIIFTNGDNDTYPCWVQQHLAGQRPDVAIVNLSLLNTTWYLRSLRERGLPIELSDHEIAQLRHTHEKSISAQMQEHIFESLRRRGWPRPLYYAVTVFEGNRILPCKTVLEGLIERIVPAEGPEQGVREQNWRRIRHLLDRFYDLGSATDAYLDWDRESAVAKLMHNYAAVLDQLGDWMLASGMGEEAGPYLYDAVRILTFHGEDEWARRILSRWEEHAGGREGKLLERARRLARE